MVISFHNHTIEVLTATTVTDRYGNASLVWLNPTVTVVEGCRVVPIVGTEVLDRLTRRMMLFAPPQTVLVSANRIRYSGTVYDVSGEVRRWPSPTGALAHIEADLERVEG